MIPVFYANKYIVIGTHPSTAKEINSINDVTESSAEFVVNSFINQMKRIDEIIKNDLILPSPRRGQREIYMGDVWPYNALLEHEKVHFNGQYEAKVINPSLDLLKDYYGSKCQPKNQFKGKSKNEIEKSFDNLKSGMIQAFYQFYDQMLDQTDNEREIPAHRNQFNFLSNLAKQIADKYHVPINLPLPR